MNDFIGNYEFLEYYDTVVDFLKALNWLKNYEISMIMTKKGYEYVYLKGSFNINFLKLIQTSIGSWHDSHEFLKNVYTLIQ